MAEDLTARTGPRLSGRHMLAKVRNEHFTLISSLNLTLDKYTCRE